MDELREEVHDLELEQVEKKLFEERRSMVEFAEEHDQWQLFDDEQSIESMRQSIEGMPDSDLKNEIRRRFNRVEFLYDEYTRRVVEDTVS